MSQLILVVDDDQMNRELLETVLKRSGYQVATANSGAQAFKAVAAQTPDLILLDVRLGEMSGYDVCARLKSEPETRPIPIIILTAADDPAERENALQAGADDFFPKMRGWQPLVESIKALIGD
jgi:CheY-like chemotaxis protein